jgi:hypothetical protein
MKSITSLQLLKLLLLIPATAIALGGCKKELDPDDNVNDTPGAIQGAPGNPRFNLQFTNGSKTDLDLYVQTPNGTVLYFGNPSGQNGQLDVDCLCGDCPNGPNENIYWTPGSAPRGTYKVWAEYFDYCDGSMSASSYTLRIMNNSSILQTYNGTLSPTNAKSPVYTFNY